MIIPCEVKNKNTNNKKTHCKNEIKKKNCLTEREREKRRKYVDKKICVSVDQCFTLWHS